jgi:hypothetical protein
MSSISERTLEREGEEEEEEEEAVLPPLGEEEAGEFVERGEEEPRLAKDVREGDAEEVGEGMGEMRGLLVEEEEEGKGRGGTITEPPTPTPPTPPPLMAGRGLLKLESERSLFD